MLSAVPPLAAQAAAPPVGEMMSPGVSAALARHRAATLRGLHYQAAPHAECKLVRCTAGAAYDVIVDLRADSPTRLR